MADRADVTQLQTHPGHRDPVRRERGGARNGRSDGACGLAGAVTPDGSTLYVVNQDSDNVSVIDTVMCVVKATIPVGAGPAAIAITPDGRHQRHRDQHRH